MLFSWWKKRRRRKLLAEPMPDSWRGHLEALPHVQMLPETLHGRLADCVRILHAEKTFEGCKGLEITEEIRITCLGLASLLLLGLSDYYFDNVETILVYPTGYRVRSRVPIAGDIALVEETDRLGEAHYRGPVILAWDEIQEDLVHFGAGRNLVFHEFAHQFDMTTGDADGVPPLPKAIRQRWQEVMAREYRRLQRAARRRDWHFLDYYGATNPAEFFAVSTEAFFDQPSEFRNELPEMYGLFRECYGVDPAGWPTESTR